MQKQRFLNTYINSLTLDETIAEIFGLVESRKVGAYITPINVDVLIKMEKDSYLHTIVNKADIALADGKPLIWISCMLKKKIKEKVSGSDLVPVLCEKAAEKGYSVFILGGKEGVAQAAARRLKELHPRLKIAGTYAPPFNFESYQKEIDKTNQIIREATPDMVIACFGCPKQEKYIYENRFAYGAKVSICAGATVDFLAGNVKRAPKWMRNYGLEWFYRFLQEPKRLFKRYFIDDIQIVRLAWKYRKQD